MIKPTDLVVWLSEVDKDDTKYVGGKGANLGEMISAKFPVPHGFVTTARAYFTFLHENKLDKAIRQLLATINYENSESLTQATRHIRKLIEEAPVPEVLVKQIFKYYEKLGKNVLVAVRSSATSEDSKAASFAGQNETFLNVRGEAALIEKIREAWASLFEARSVFYRNENRIDHLKTGIALVVQKMVESETSGVMFTIDPVTNNKRRIIIEAIYGLGEYIVQGKVTPDHYEVDKQTLMVVDKKIEEQYVMYVKKGVENKELKVSQTARSKQKITDHDIVELTKLGVDLEKHYYFPQDIEWAKEGNKLFIVQTRPITTINKKQSTTENKTEGKLVDAKSQHPILLGDPASPGIGIGAVKVLKSPAEIGKVKTGDVLVAPYTSPDYVPAMKRAAAIVTERGGRTSHAAIVSREFGIPAVVGAEHATSILRDNEVVTVNGKSGEIFKGSIHLRGEEVGSGENLKTKTHVLVNLAEPELAARVAAKEVDGVGLLRAEFMIAEIGIHPRKLIKDKKEKVFIEKLAAGLTTFCQAFYPRPIIYRATDFKTNEYSNLKGGREFEPVESNPMLGYRGAYRYINDPRVFKLELEAIKYVRNKKKLNNLHLMIPFVRTPKELSEVKKIVVESGLRRSPTFHLIMMVEIPSNVILIEDFVKVGIDGISIGSNDLTMLMLGIDRDNEEVAIEFDERNEAVLWALEKVIKTCKAKGVTSSICGQAPSEYPDLVEKLVEWGITSVSVAPDAIENTRRTVYRIEKKQTHAKD